MKPSVGTYRRERVGWLSGRADLACQGASQGKAGRYAGGMRLKMFHIDQKNREPEPGFKHLYNLPQGEFFITIYELVIKPLFI
jgi:hypothetical protein